MVLGVLALQGFILASLLYFNRTVRTVSTRILAVLVGLFSMILIEEAMESINWHQTFVRITGSGFFLELFIGPLTLIYAQSLTSRGKVTARQGFLHLTGPVLIHIVYLPYHFVISWPDHLINNPSLSDVMLFSISSKIFYQVSYLGTVIYKLTIFLKHTRDEHVRTAKWLRNVLFTVMVLIPSVMILEVVRENMPFESDDATNMIMILSIYSIGYAAIMDPQVYPRAKEMMSVKSKIGSEKYQTSSLSHIEKKELVAEIQRFMDEEKPFIKSTLSLDELASGLQLRGHDLSQVLNEQLNQNFYDFINSYRVKEVIKRFAAQDHLQKKLLAIAFESGFNSKATFNRSFKKMTGLTPKQYIMKG